MTLAVSCDCLIIANDVNISYSEIIIGVILASHFVHSPCQIGCHKGFEKQFASDTMSVLEAECQKLVNYAVPRDQVMGGACEMGTRYAAISPVFMEFRRDPFMWANEFEHRRTIKNTVETICNIINTADS